jgi:cytochrome c oxidase subunit 4
MKDKTKKLGGVWLALLLLLALSCASAYLSMGTWNTVANIGIAVIKACLVAVFFMHILQGGAAFRLVLIAALFALALLMGLSSADYATRTRYPAPWQVPAGAS